MENRFNFTDDDLAALPLPEAGKRVVYYDEGGARSVPGLQVRVSSTGTKTFSVLRRVSGGSPERVTLGNWPKLALKEARKLAREVMNNLAEGISRTAEKKADKVKQAQVPTLAAAVEDYVTSVTKKGSGKHLKPRTQSDYRRMVASGKPKAKGGQTLDGELFTLASLPITDITADHIKTLYNDIRKERGDRRAAYAVTVLRAVLTRKNITVKGDPFGKETHGEDHYDLPTHQGKPKPIKKSYLGAWWNMAGKAGTGEVGGSKLAADYYRFRLLTGTREVEVLGDNYGNKPIKVGDVDLKDASIELKDTKNRENHTLYLSRQALEIVQRNVKDKKPDDPLFPVGDPRKTLKAINKAAGLGELAVQGHDLRDTFITVAKSLVSYYVLKKLANHKIQSSDVTGTSYAEVDEDELRAGWQLVADAIEARAAAATAEAKAEVVV